MPELFLPLTGLRAAESDIDSCVFGGVAIITTLVFAASGLAVVIFNFRGAGITCIVFAMGQPTVLARTKAGHKCHENCHGLLLLLAEVSGEPLVMDVMLEGH